MQTKDTGRNAPYLIARRLWRRVPIRHRERMNTTAKQAVAVLRVVGMAPAGPSRRDYPITVSVDPAPSPWTSTEAPLVTIVVTAHNRQHLVDQTLRSVQLQGFDRFECIVVDDGSTDDTALKVHAFVKADDRFRLVSHPEPCGLPAARNTGIAHASTEYVGFLDDDDFLLTGSIQRRYAILKSDERVAGVYCDWVAMPASANLSFLGSVHKPRSLGRVSLSSLNYSVPFISSSPLFRRDALVSSGGYNESLRNAEDAELVVRLVRSGYVFDYARTVGIGYRRSRGSMVLTDPTSQFESMREVARWLDTKVGPELLSFGPCPWPDENDRITRSFVSRRIHALPRFERTIGPRSSVQISHRQPTKPEFARFSER